MLFVSAFFQWEIIPIAKATIVSYQGDLILQGNNVTVIEGRFDINGSIIVEENATLILKNASLNFTQVEGFQFNMTFRNPTNGNPRFIVNNATLASSNYYMEIEFRGNSSTIINELTVMGLPRLRFNEDAVADLSHSSLYKIYAYGNSTLNILNCTFYTMDSWENRTVQMQNCTIERYVEILAHSINCSIFNLKAGLVNYWSFIKNCTVEIATDGYAPNLTLLDTVVGGWWFDVFYGTSNITISHSNLYGLGAGESVNVTFYNSTIDSQLRIYDSAKIHLYDTTTQELDSNQRSQIWLVNSTFTYYDINDQSRIYTMWYLDVQVLDSIDQDVPNANVTVRYQNTTVLETKLTDTNGLARSFLMEKMTNATRDYLVGNYTVETVYQQHRANTTVNMTENKQITLILDDFVIPEFSFVLILTLAMMITLLIYITEKVKVIREKRNLIP